MTTINYLKIIKFTLIIYPQHVKYCLDLGEDIKKRIVPNLHEIFNSLSSSDYYFYQVTKFIEQFVPKEMETLIFKANYCLSQATERWEPQNHIF